MAVESRFVVIRHGVEVETFMDKKAADEYDKMLDMADNLAEMFEQAPIELNESAIEELSVYLAKHRDDVLIALQAKKPAAVKKAPAAKAKAAEKPKPTEKTKAVKSEESDAA
ncbi:YebG family protein [Thalassotalea marina]|uniref:2-hydroxyacid dehydrogenase n=1 Tax=Thalassotalea marina TaxID=1673741 RepID=A0A919BD99_9GAMM|nr:YebG family protein [Thalassotalea marina]GHF84020.1 2-hydroxyacid dehydrogenase [Thalassotalea marina]